jgi:hypothetical protein
MAVERLRGGAKDSAFAQNSGGSHGGGCVGGGSHMGKVSVCVSNRLGKELKGSISWPALRVADGWQGMRLEVEAA